MDHAAWKGGVWILYFGAGLPKSESFPLSTKELYLATVSSSAAAGMGCELIGIRNLSGQFRDGIRTEEPAAPIDIGRPGIPLFALNGVRVEDRPDGSAPVDFGVLAHVSVGAQAGVQKIVSLIHFVPESLPDLVHQDDVLKVSHA